MHLALIIRPSNSSRSYCRQRKSIMHFLVNTRESLFACLSVSTSWIICKWSCMTLFSSVCPQKGTYHLYLDLRVKLLVTMTPQVWPHTLNIAFRYLPRNSATFGYATEGALFISAQLSADAVSAFRKVWVLIRLWKQHNVNMRRGTSAAGKKEERKKKKKKRRRRRRRVLSRLKRFWFRLCWRKQHERLPKKRSI